MTDNQQAQLFEAPPASLRSLGPQLLSRVFNTPLLIEPDKLQAIMWALSQQRSGIEVDRPLDEAVMQPACAVGRWENRDRERGSGMIIDGGVGIIPITGTLVNRGAWIGTYSGMQSYEGIAQQLRMAADDTRVKQILLELNSYGGEAAGVADLAEEIRELSATKPVTALVADAAASAAYWIASAADRVFVTESAIAGSIGVVLTHQDVTGMVQKMGVKITQIHAGADKLLGSPFKPLSSDDRAKMQAAVDEIYGQFVGRVAKYRAGAEGEKPKITEKAIRATEARVYRGARAVTEGLADGVTTGRALLAELQSLAKRGGSRTPKGAVNMSQTKSQGGAEASATYTQEELDQAKADVRAEERAKSATAIAEASKTSATAERTRIETIMTHAEAAGREKSAAHLAFKTDQSPESATALLATMPKQASTGSLADLMRAASPAIPGQDGDGTKRDAGAPVINPTSIFDARRQASAK